jgi:hypothetical protein
VAEPYGNIGAANPPPTGPGMVQVSLNAAGNLRWFSAIPLPDVQPAADPSGPDAVFHAAGLDAANFTEMAPKFVPLGAADRLRAWKGPHPKIPSLDLTVEMATWQGRITTVHVLNNWKGETPGSAGSVGWQIREILLLVMAASGVLSAILLARRNWRLGRVDRKGALRVGMARFFLAMVVWLGTVHAVPSADMILLVLSSLATWLLWGAGFWLLYLALEPAVRAYWPHSIVTWNRIVAGQWKDAQVASHILIGAAAGAAVWTTAGLTDYFRGAGLTNFSGLAAAIDTRHWVAFHADTLGSSLGVGMAIFFALTGLRRLVKKDLIAATLAAMFFTFSNGDVFSSSNWQVKAAIYLFIFAILLLILLRYGLVTIIVAAFFIDTLDSIGLGVDWKTWYAPAGLANVALLAGIAVYAFWRSMGTGNSAIEAAG